ncbi:MAG: LTA synthase family protein, partial [Anaerovibrio sp.]|nr:LTA synthase family protein [Anaerovibrio sp.]
MFDAFFMGWQQDIKIALLPPLMCAIFRLIFITYFGPKSLGEWGREKLYHCFRYGFWWGMDFNAYTYLISLIAVSLPGAFLPQYFAVGDTVRTALMLVYLFVLYVFFWVKMIFYYHYHDIINSNILFGKNADKRNLADIFFNQNHGLWILLSFIPYLAVCGALSMLVLSIPSVEFLSVDNPYLQYACNTAMFLASIAIFYWFRFGGTFRHRNKPEWDEVPTVVKEDVFLGKATMDDLIALEIVLKHPLPAFVSKDDEEAKESIRRLCPEFKGDGDNPLEYFRHIA